MDAEVVFDLSGFIYALGFNGLCSCVFMFP